MNSACPTPSVPCSATTTASSWSPVRSVPAKSTTLAALINEINNDRTDHIITLEDPIEYVIDSGNCQVNQREIHTHTDSFSTALRAALREDPDVIMVGEMRDLETISLGHHGGGDRSPGARHPAHRQCRPNARPGARRVPHRTARADPNHGRRIAARHHFPATGSQQGRRRPIPGPRTAGQHARLSPPPFATARPSCCRASCRPARMSA